MSVEAVAHAFTVSLPGVEKWVLVCLARYADEWGYSVFPALDDLAEKAGFSETTCKRTVRELVKLGRVMRLAQATPVSPAFYQIVGVPPPEEPKAVERHCPAALRRAVLFEFGLRCEFCRRTGQKEVGPDGKQWVIERIAPDIRGGVYSPDNVTLSCRGCHGRRKARASSATIRSLTILQAEKEGVQIGPSPGEGVQVAPSPTGGIQPAPSLLGGSNLDPPPGVPLDPGRVQLAPRGDPSSTPGGCQLDPDLYDHKSTDHDQVTEDRAAHAALAAAAAHGDTEPRDPENPAPAAAGPSDTKGLDPEDRIDALGLAWNERVTAPLKPVHSTWIGKRRMLAGARLDQLPLAVWCTIIDRINASSFCRGRNARHFVATFDWLISSPDPGIKALEGQWDDTDAYVDERQRHAEEVRAEVAAFAASARDEQRSLARHIERVIARLNDEVAGSCPAALYERKRSIANEIASVGACEVNGQELPTMVIDRLAALDAELLAAAREAVARDSASWRALERDVEIELAPFIGTMKRDAAERVRAGMLRNKLRQRFRLPILAWSEGAAA